jgi:hypothetical protein
MRTHATSRIGETGLQNCQKTKESLGNIGIFLLPKPNFPHTKFDFHNPLSAFFNDFLIFSTAFCFLQWLSDLPQWLSAFQEIQEKLFTARSMQKITI